MKKEFGLFVQDKILDFVEGTSKRDFSEISIKTPVLKFVMKREVEETPVNISFVPSTVKKVSSPGDIAPQKKVSEDIEEVKSRWVGVFFYNKKEDKLSSGDKVDKGRILGFVRCMNLDFEIISPVDGEIAQVLVDDEEKVEYDTVLFKLNKRRD